MKSFDQVLKDLDEKLSLYEGDQCVVSFNVLAECMNIGKFFEQVIPWCQRSSMLKRIFQLLVKHNCIVCLQELDQQTVDLLDMQNYTLIRGQGFRFGTGIYAPRDLILEAGVVEGASMKIPGDAMADIAIVKEWGKRTAPLVYIKTRDFYVFTTHYPLCLAMPAIKVLYTASIRSQISKIAGDQPHLLMVDANTMPIEQTFKYLTEPGFIPTDKYLPWEDFPASLGEEYTIDDYRIITNHAKAPGRPAFKGTIDYALLNPALVDQFTWSSVTAEILHRPQPSQIWPSDHTLIAVTLSKIQS